MTNFILKGLYIEAALLYIHMGGGVVLKPGGKVSGYMFTKLFKVCRENQWLQDVRYHEEIGVGAI